MAVDTVTGHVSEWSLWPAQTPLTFTLVDLADGTVGAPALSFTSDLDTGLYRIGANNLGFAVNGVRSFDISTAGMLLATGARVTGIADEDTMSSNSATLLATQQSIKAYVDAQILTTDTWAEILAIGNTSGANDVIINSTQKLYMDGSASGDTFIVESAANVLDFHVGDATNEELQITITGVIIAGTLLASGITTLASSSLIGNLTLGDGSIIDSSGAISFGNENLSTNGTLVSGALSVTGSADISTTMAIGSLAGSPLTNQIVRLGHDFGEVDVDTFGITIFPRSHEADAATANILHGFNSVPQIGTSNTQNWTATVGVRAFSSGFLNSSGSGILTGFAGFHVANASTGITITNQYGIYIESLTAATNNWAIYTNVGEVRFGGNLSIDVTTPGLFLKEGGTSLWRIDTGAVIGGRLRISALGTGDWIQLNPAAGTGVSINAGNKFWFDGGPTGDTYMFEESPDDWHLVIGGTTYFQIDQDLDGMSFGPETPLNYIAYEFGRDSISNGASTEARTMRISSQLTGASADTSSLALFSIEGNIVTQTATENIADIAALIIREPTITDNLTGDVTRASTLLVDGIPTEGETNAGLTIDGGASDAPHFAMSNSDVVTGLSTLPQGTIAGDWFYCISKASSAAGGAFAQAFGETTQPQSYFHDSWAGAPAITDTSASLGAINFFAGQHDGANAALNMAADSNLFAVGEIDSGVVRRTRLLLKADDGELHLGNSTVVGLDAEDDRQLVRVMQIESAVGGIILSEWDNPFYSYFTLRDLGLAGPKDNEGFFLFPLQSRLHAHEGAIWQNYVELREHEARFSTVEERLEAVEEANQILTNQVLVLDATPEA